MPPSVFPIYNMATIRICHVLRWVGQRSLCSSVGRPNGERPLCAHGIHASGRSRKSRALLLDARLSLWSFLYCSTRPELRAASLQKGAKMVCNRFPIHRSEKSYHQTLLAGVHLGRPCRFPTSHPTPCQASGRVCAPSRGRSHARPDT
jgi:hypothetical protein